MTDGELIWITVWGVGTLIGLIITTVMYKLGEIDEDKLLDGVMLSATWLPVLAIVMVLALSMTPVLIPYFLIKTIVDWSNKNENN
jgi:Flp pilus assembly protein protease CpaA